MPLDRLIFFPAPDVPDPPPGVEERAIATADGLRLHAWWAGSPEATATLVWSHGNGGNIAGRAGIFLALAARERRRTRLRLPWLRAERGAPSEPSVYLDAEAAYDSLRARGVPAGRIVAFGESLGGAVAIRLASVRPCAGVAVVSTFTTLRDAGRPHYGPLALLAGERFDSLARVAGLSVPIFVAHGDRDEVVPFALGERLFAAAREPKRFFRVPGGHHNDVFDAPGLLEAIVAFAREVTA